MKVFFHGRMYCITVQHTSIYIVHIHSIFCQDFTHDIQTNVEDISTIIPHFYILVLILTFNICLQRRHWPESKATLPPFGPIEGHKWFFQMFSHWEYQNSLSYLFRQNPVLSHCIGGLCTCKVIIVCYDTRPGGGEGGRGPRGVRTIQCKDTADMEE